MLQVAVNVDPAPIKVNRNVKPLDLEQAINKCIEELIQLDDNPNDDIKRRNATNTVHTNIKNSMDRHILKNIGQLNMWARRRDTHNMWRVISKCTSNAALLTLR